MIKHNGMEFESIERFDGHVLDFVKGINGTRCAGWCTTLPISDLEYRQEHYEVDYAKVVVSVGAFFTLFNITGDHGLTYSVQISNDQPEVIAKSIVDIANNEIGFILEFAE